MVQLEDLGSRLLSRGSRPGCPTTDCLSAARLSCGLNARLVEIEEDNHSVGTVSFLSDHHKRNRVSSFLGATLTLLSFMDIKNFETYYSYA